MTQLYFRGHFKVLMCLTMQTNFSKMMAYCRQVIKSQARKDRSCSLAVVTEINATAKIFDDYSQEVVINEKSLGLFDL